MATMKELLEKKGSLVHWVSPDATVLEATQLMNRHQIGAVVVHEPEATGKQDRMGGIFTERDVLRRVVAMERNPATTLVHEVMTRNVAFASEETTLEEAAAAMKFRRIRHLPVCGSNGEVLGLISIGDINAWEADGQETTIHWLSEYIQGRV